MTGSHVSVFVRVYVYSSYYLRLYLRACAVCVRSCLCVCFRLPCTALQEPEKETDRNEPVTMVIAHLPYRSALPQLLDRCQHCQHSVIPITAHCNALARAIPSLVCAWYYQRRHCASMCHFGVPKRLWQTISAVKEPV